MNKKKNISQEAKETFKRELQALVKQKCDEINHYVSGVNSPFTYLQIRGTQEYLNEILDELGISGTE